MLPRDTGKGVIHPKILGDFRMDMRHSGIGLNKTAIALRLQPMRLQNYLLGHLLMPAQVQKDLRILLDRELKKKKRKNAKAKSNPG